MDEAWLRSRLDVRPLDRVHRPRGRQAPRRRSPTGSTSTDWRRSHAARHAARGGDRARAARGACRADGLSIRAMAGELGVELHDRPPLAAPLRAQHAAGPAARRDSAGPCDGRRDRRGDLSGARADHVRAASAATASAAGAAGSEAVRPPAARGQAHARRGGRRLAADLRLRPLRSARCSSITSTRRRRRSPCPRGGVARSLETARAEAAKCVLVCANCHAEIEAGLATIARRTCRLP